MRSIPVKGLVVVVTTNEVCRRGTAHWRGHWFIYPYNGAEQEPGRQELAHGDTDLYLSEENAYLFAGTDGVAVAKRMTIPLSPTSSLSPLGDA